MGRLSEEFGGRLPSEILAEWQRLPVGFMEQLLEYRQFSRDWAAVKSLDTSDKREPYRGTGLFDLAEEIEVTLAEREIADEGEGLAR